MSGDRVNETEHDNQPAELRDEGTKVVRCSPATTSAISGRIAMEMMRA